MARSHDCTPPNPREDFHDREDAPRKELIVYSFGGIIDEIGLAGFRTLGTLLTIGFGLSPLIAGFLSALKTLWDGTMDPIVAHLSDNFKSRWGRRRPFILVGGILMALFSWITWTFLPNTARVQPNEPIVPLSHFSDSHWKRFGEMLLGYDAPETRISLTFSNGVATSFTDTTLSLYLEKVFKDLSTASKSTIALSGSPVPLPADAPWTGSGYRLHFDFVQFNSPAAADTAEGTAISVRTRIFNGPTASALVDTVSRVELSAQPVAGLTEQKTFLENLFELIAGKPKQASLQWSSGEESLRTNTRVQRNRERALLASIQYSSIHAVGTHLALPYWRVWPDTASIPASTKAQVFQRAQDRFRTEPDWLRSLLFGAGVDLRLPPANPAPADAAAIATFSNTARVHGDDALFEHLWNELPIQDAASLLGVARHPQKAKEQRGMWQNLSAGFAALKTADPEDRKLLWFVLIMYAAMSVAQTLYQATYYALGIEIAPSYEGRTRAMAYRSFTGGLINIIGAAFLPFCLLPIFTDFREGSRILSTIMIFVGVPLSIWCFYGTRERTVVVRAKNKKPSFFRSVREIGSQLEFWRITGIYFLLGKAIGIFQVFGMFIVVYYVCGGNLLLGTSYGAAVGIVTTLISICSIPLVVWMCKRFEKQNAFRIALTLLLIGSVLKYFCYNPRLPELMFIVPFFYALGHSALYNILATMMADVTDLDELRGGERREGMFGAVVSVINKSTASISTVISGAMVVAAGFEIEKGVHQAPGVFHRMLILFSIVPAIAGLAGFFLLYKYPLTRRRVEELKEQLAVQRRNRVAEPQPDAEAAA